MPELPEVEHVVRALRRVVVGRRIVAAEVTLPKLILPTSASAFRRKLKGSIITGVSRRGKFVLIQLSGALPDGRASAPARTSEHVVAVHLRMTNYRNTRARFFTSTTTGGSSSAISESSA